MKIDLSFGSKRYVLQAIYINIKNINNDFFRKCYTLPSFYVLRIYFYVSLNLVAMPNHCLNFYKVHDKAP